MSLDALNGSGSLIVITMLSAGFALGKAFDIALSRILKAVEERAG